MNPKPNHYRVIYADPPWTFKTYSKKGKGRSAEAHYDCMTLDDIRALPVAGWAAEDAVLLLWVTDPFLMTARSVIEACGFTYKTVGFTWAKCRDSGTITSGEHPIGCGYWTRSNPEQCLLATRGRPRRLDASIRQLVI